MTLIDEQNDTGTTVSDIYKFLASLPLFDLLTDEEVALIAGISHEYSFKGGSVIAYQRDVADRFYLVKSGRLYAEHLDKEGCVHKSVSYNAGEYFDEAWLFEQAAHPCTIYGKDDGRLVIITQKDFLHFLRDNPTVLDGFKPYYDEESGEHVAGLSEKAWEMAQRTSISADKASKSVELMPDELVEFYTRRSRWYLFVKMVPPILGIFFALVLAIILLGGGIFNGKMAFANLALPSFVFVIPTILGIFYILDWRNDYFVITNKHLSHHEFDLTKLRSRVNKIPIDKIQSISTVKPSFYANLFNYGTARITTSSQTGNVYFDNIDQPERVTATLERLQKHSKNLTAGLIQAAMRGSLESHFQSEPPITAIKEKTAVSTPKKAESASQTFSRNIKRRYGTHLVEEGTITYRKNFFALMQTIIWPLITNIIILIILGLIINFYGAVIPLLCTSSSVAFILLLTVGWLIWQVEDWRNDAFQLTPLYVIDIDRKPFGISESRKQAGLDKVQNVTANKPTFWATVWNYGDVHIETAGAVADIIFEQVSHPNRVQSEIFQRLEQHKQRAKVSEGAQRRKEYAVLMDVYKQATEQNRIPRRTPLEAKQEDKKCVTTKSEKLEAGEN